MKVIVNQSNLRSAIAAANRAVPAKPTHPVLANILLEALSGEKKLILTGFDLSLGIRVEIDADVQESGICAVPAKTFSEIIYKLPEGEIKLSTESGEENFFHIKPKSGKYKIKYMEPDEFPALPIIDDAQELKINRSSFMDGLRFSLVSVSEDETKQILTGVHLTTDGDSLEFGATDGHRLSIMKVEADGLDKAEVTIPGNALTELSKIPCEDENITVQLGEGMAIFEWSGMRFTTRTLEGQYPAYNQLTPKAFDRNVVVDRKQFIAAIERQGVLADAKNHLMKMSLNTEAQEITLSAEAQDVGSGTEVMSAQITGNDVLLAFNIKYLLEGLKSMSSAEVQICINQPLTPVILKPVSGANQTHLVMPVQIRS